MEMKEYLIATFLFNDQANKKMIEKLATLPDPAEGIRYFSHLANSQYKWMARIMQDPGAPQMSWWEPVYPLDALEKEWQKSLQPWLDLVESKTEAELADDVEFIGYDGTRWTARLMDIALQLNYHSIHHRAQMQLVFRNQGLEPDFIDYIGTKYRRIDR
ncbi:MAG TPA: DinB family protein [Puia sp.]|nr:DinB family protein [Puia sp.]